MQISARTKIAISVTPSHVSHFHRTCHDGFAFLIIRIISFNGRAKNIKAVFILMQLRMLKVHIMMQNNYSRRHLKHAAIL